MPNGTGLVTTELPKDAMINPPVWGLPCCLAVLRKQDGLEEFTAAPPQGL